MAFIRVPKYRILLAIGFVIVLMLACLQIAAPAQAGAIDSDMDTQELPGSGSQLPLIAFLGLGMLAGGLISVLNTRPEKRAVHAS